MYCSWTRNLSRQALPFLAAGCLLLSCESERPPATFYAMDSLVTSQVKHLTGIGARLLKEGQLAGERDTLTYRPDEREWRRELGVFSKLDEINKPLNKTNYEVSDGLLDPESNLTVKAFTSLADLPVVYLKIYYQGTLAKPRKIEALYDEDNMLFSSARKLSMHFRQVGDRTVLTSYTVNGGQKMVFGDSVAFAISGKILID